MQGYRVMADEAAGQLPAASADACLRPRPGSAGWPRPSVAHLLAAARRQAARAVVVEPDAADCLLPDRARRPADQVPGRSRHVMAGLAAGEVSLLAWDILNAGSNAFLTLPDEAAVAA